MAHLITLKRLKLRSLCDSMGFYGPFFLIDNLEDFPFEKSKKITKQPLGLPHGIMNERNAGYGAWGECDFNANANSV